MENLYLNKDFFERKADYSGLEAKLYIYIYEDKLIKIFDSRFIIDNKLKKLEVISKIDDDIIKPTDIVYVDGIASGYAMEYKSTYKQLDILKPRFITSKFKIVKNVLKQIEILHENGIIYGDLHHGNVLVDDNCNVYLCDLDNTKIGEYKFDYLNCFEQIYFYKTHQFDYQIDYYHFNILMATLLFNTHEYWTMEHLNKNKFLLSLYNKDSKEIIEAMNDLSSSNKDKIKPLIKKF